jgi:hypothetical protein
VSRLATLRTGMGRWTWAAAVAVGASLVAAGPASAGTYDVVSCGAPGAGGVNRAWQVAPDFTDAYWNITTSCPSLGAYSEPNRNVVAPYFTGAGFQLDAPPGAILDRMVIWRHGYRFNNELLVQGYRRDATVIGGPLGGETCTVQPGQTHCEFGAPGAMSAASRVERDLETTRVLYSAACAVEAGCRTAGADNDFPLAGLSISGSVVTVRDEAIPALTAGGDLLAGGWITTDAPLSFGATDPVGIRQARVLVDGAPVHTVEPGCDYHLMAPCGQVAERAVALGAGLPDGVHTVSVEATDTAGNVARTDHQVSADRLPPAIAFAPSAGRGRRVVVDAPDPGSGTVAGTIEVRRRGRFRALRTTLRGGRLIARMRGSRAGRTFRATATDGLGRTAQIVGAPVRLSAGFGPRMREGINGGPRGRPVVRGRLRAWRGRALAGQPIAVLTRLRVDGAAEEVAATASTGPGGRFRVRLPAGASRAVRVVSAGNGGLQAGLRRLRYRVPWSSTLRVRRSAIPRGGRLHLSGRLRLRGFTLPPSGTRVEMQAYERGRWRVFATTRTRGKRAKWRASYRFGGGTGSFRIRVRIPHNGVVPLERGYSRSVTVRVG